MDEQLWVEAERQVEVWVCGCGEAGSSEGVVVNQAG